MIMELPQPRSYGGEGRKPTRDFLSLCSHSSTLHQDPTPSSQGGFLKTHDFLGKTSAKGEAGSEISSTVLEKPPPPAPPHSVEHVLPGGIGTYSISHISYFNQQRVVPKPEAGAAVFTAAQASSSERNEENSNCSSYANSGFTLWDESAAKKGKTGKENIQTSAATDAAKFGQQWASPEKPTQSSSNNNHRGSFSSLSSSQPSGHKSQSFMDMIKSAKSGSIQDEELLDDDDDFSLKRELSPLPKGELRIKVDGKSSDQKANTPRSKHSATEQRRRSKINDRFQRLRGLIPHSDHKRDKASFLLEVIEYIQFLQEKVHKYEGSHQGWNNNPAKLMSWRNGQRPGENFADPSQALNNAPAPALIFANENKITAVPTVPRNAQVPLESDMSASTTFKTVEHHPGLTNTAVPFPMALHPNILAPVRTGSVGAQLAPRICPDVENAAAKLTPQMGQANPCANECPSLSDKLKEQDLAIEGGTISISSAYSRGLLNALSRALQSSGVDLSQANISVQIELGKRANSRLNIPTSVSKENEIPPSNQGVMQPRIASEDSNQPLKKLKTTKI